MATKAENKDTSLDNDLHVAIEMAACDLVVGACAVFNLTKTPVDGAQAADEMRAAVHFVAAALLARAQAFHSGMDTVKPMAKRLTLLSGKAAS